ncbi:MAG: hypothetical protein HYY93_09290 [Planctomycetes bacterium]|nr:hypothetical protein [Planctomycetota bacterium]
MSARLITPYRRENSVTALKAEIDRLSYDDAFGMLTRPALLEHVTRLAPGRYCVVFLDLNGVHALNGILGMEEVNRRVRNSFALAFRHTDLVARWFSGDEIVVILPDDATATRGLTQRLQREASEHGLSFCSAAGVWNHPRDSLGEIVPRLARTVHARKEVNAMQR